MCAVRQQHAADVPREADVGSARKHSSDVSSEAGAVSGRGREFAGMEDNSQSATKLESKTEHVGTGKSTVACNMVSAPETRVTLTMLSEHTWEPGFSAGGNCESIAVVGGKDCEPNVVSSGGKASQAAHLGEDQTGSGRGLEDNVEAVTWPDGAEVVIRLEDVEAVTRRDVEVVNRSDNAKSSTRQDNGVANVCARHGNTERGRDQGASTLCSRRSAYVASQQGTAAVPDLAGHKTEDISAVADTAVRIRTPKGGAGCSTAEGLNNYCVKARITGDVRNECTHAARGQDETWTSCEISTLGVRESCPESGPVVDNIGAVMARGCDSDSQTGGASEEVLGSAGMSTEWWR